MTSVRISGKKRAAMNPGREMERTDIKKPSGGGGGGEKYINKDGTASQTQQENILRGTTPAMWLSGELEIQTSSNSNRAAI
jgi:hypothetical protein